MSLDFLWGPGGIIGVVIAGLLTVVGIAVQKRKPRTDRQAAIIATLDAMVEQLQEERDKADELRREAIASRVEAAKAHRARVESLERRIRILQDYANQLRAHIVDGNPPPPPPWPKELHSDQ